MTFLLDTNVLSEMRKRERNKGVAEWIAATPPERQHLSVVTVGEITRGITRVRARGDHHQVAIFESWLENVVDTFGDRIVPLTLDVARKWGAQSERQPIPVPAALIAATAEAHDWTLVTRNVKDFERTGVRVLNPFTE